MYLCCPPRRLDRSRHSNVSKYTQWHNAIQSLLITVFQQAGTKLQWQIQLSLNMSFKLRDFYCKIQTTKTFLDAAYLFLHFLSTERRRCFMMALRVPATPQIDPALSLVIDNTWAEKKKKEYVCILDSNILTLCEVCGRDTLDCRVRVSRRCSDKGTHLSCFICWSNVAPFGLLIHKWCCLLQRSNSPCHRCIPLSLLKWN